MERVTRLPERMLRMALGGLVAASLLTGASGLRAAEEQLRPEHYAPVVLQKDGTVSGGELDRLTATLQAELKSPDEPIVVLVHGFALQQKDAVASFETVAGRLRAEAAAAGLPIAAVGVHWAADAGTPGAWLPRAVGHRLTSLLGLKNAVRNPYQEKAELAAASGRQGLRSVLFRLHDRFPTSPVHLWVHSMGAQVALSALCPEMADAEKKAGAIEQPARTLKVGLLTLAGADLDYDLFCRKGADTARCALARAQVWWVTVPEKDHADGVLELRRGIGKGDALGNRGLKLGREDLSDLLSRRALVVDQGNIPAGHEIEDYYNRRRVRELVRSMLYLYQPENAEGRQSILASLDEFLRPDACSGPAAPREPSATFRLYASWRGAGHGEQAGVVLARRAPEPRSKVAGLREATR